MWVHLRADELTVYKFATKELHLITYTDVNHPENIKRNRKNRK